MDFNSGKPIYLQIADYIKAQIMAGEYGAGEKIPSVRELSMILQVNPNTVCKALVQLEDEGLIVTERTNGKFVTTSDVILQKEKEKKIRRITECFVEQLESIGVKKQDIENVLISYLKEIK